MLLYLSVHQQIVQLLPVHYFILDLYNSFQHISLSDETTQEQLTGEQRESQCAHQYIHDRAGQHLHNNLGKYLFDPFVMRKNNGIF